ncbi:MAG: KH domain-containing protein [Candidatus Woesearchaeota archaeon]
MYELKIPKGRVGCLIGKKGEIKKIIERSTKSRIRVSREGDVEIEGEGLGGFICEKIVKAVGRGFNPEIALNLVRDDYELEIIDIKEFCAGSKKKIIRVKSRLIGSEGKARTIIERLTGCNICIYGKTVSTIGRVDRLSVCHRAIEKLLHGSPHGKVYGFVEREMKRIVI